MGVIYIDSEDSTGKLKISGDIHSLLKNRRAAALFRDSGGYTILDDTVLEISVAESLRETLSWIEVAARYAKCEVEYSQTTNQEINGYLAEEQKFSDFSEKARLIRDNHCDIDTFNQFKDALIDYLPCRTLYPLQMLSAYHLAFSQNACNFSVPGAGKTSIVYGAYAYLKHLPDSDSKKVERLLIISPLNAFGPWELEFEECFGVKPTTKRLVGPLSLDAKKQYFYESYPAEITLLSYQSVISLADEIQVFLRRHKVMVVLDEAHKIKNTSGGITAESILSLSESCASRVVLTGTPAPNGYEDLYNLFKFIWPTKDLIKFQIGQLKDMSKTPGDSRIDMLLDAISPFFIRIKKSDLGIPEPTIHPPIVVKMGDIQRRIYDYIERKYINDIANSPDQRFKDVLVQARLIRLQQAATNPLLLRQPLSDFLEGEQIFSDNITEDTVMLNEILNYEKHEIPAKFVAAKDLILDIIERGEKVVVWACFIKNIESFSSYLSSLGIDNRTLYGATPVAGDSIDENDESYVFTRESIVREFHNPESPFKVIIANPFAVAESISLHKACHNAIYIERSFNAAHFLQSKDRIHRYGLTQDVVTNYYYLLSENSIDSTIHERLDIKEKRMLDLMESMPIPLFDNVSDDGGDEDVKAVLRDYARRIKTL